MSFNQPQTKLGKAAKFGLVTMPLSIFGWELNKQLFFAIKKNWARAVHPVCPSCETSTLQKLNPITETISHEHDGKPLVPWRCPNCGYGVLAANNKELHSAVQAHHASQISQKVAAIAPEERQKFVRGHQMACRIFYAVSVLTFLWAMVLIASGVKWLIAINWLACAVMFFIFGLKRAYRSWQAQHGQLFQKGAFVRWLSHEKWLI